MEWVIVVLSLLEIEISALDVGVQCFLHLLAHQFIILVSNLPSVNKIERASCYVLWVSFASLSSPRDKERGRERERKRGRERERERDRGKERERGGGGAKEETYFNLKWWSPTES